jgi:hypothetical protein
MGLSSIAVFATASRAQHSVGHPISMRTVIAVMTVIPKWFQLLASRPPQPTNRHGVTARVAA